MIERDDNFPDFDDLMTELNHAKSVNRKLDVNLSRKAA